MFLDRLIPIDSERFRALGFPYEILETPGHTADHISLLVGDKLFCGDAAMNSFPSRRRTIIWIENPAVQEILGRDPAKSPRHALPRTRQALQNLGPPEIPEEPGADQTVPAQIGMNSWKPEQ